MEADAVAKGPPPDGVDAIPEDNLGEVLAILKGTCPNRDHAVGDGHAGQVLVRFESAVIGDPLYRKNDRPAPFVSLPPVQNQLINRHETTAF